MLTKPELRFIANDYTAQREVVQLLGRCFPKEWGPRAARKGDFPHYALSFVSLDDKGAITGHVGLLPMMVSDGFGKRVLLGGIASVGVAPECRGQGLASSLCRMAAQWATREGYAALPLFTALGRVYQSAGWQDYPAEASCTLIPKHNMSGRNSLRNGAELSLQEQESIRRFYAEGEDFPGKLFRAEENCYQGWPHLFASKSAAFALTDFGYALFLDGFLAECYAPAGRFAELLNPFLLPPAFAAALPPEHPVIRELTAAGWEVIDDKPDVWHGEHVLSLNAASTLPPRCRFPLADKF